MKSVFYRLFALVYNFFVRFKKPDKGLVALISPHRADFNDGLGLLEKKLLAQGRRVLRLSRSDLDSPLRAAAFFTVKAAALAGAGEIYLNDNFSPLAYLKIPRGCRVTQLWHAMGAFKKFGLDVPQPEDIRRRELEIYAKYDRIICSSADIVDIYAGAFGADRSRVLPLGSLTGDLLLERAGEADSLKAGFRALHPECAGKKLILYAPTFRDDPERDAVFLDSFDFSLFLKELGGEYALLLRLHPQIHPSFAVPDGVIDLTAHPDAAGLAVTADALITDYSSICMDFVLLGKPCFFFAPDLSIYEKRRSFYHPYAETVPGPVSFDTPALINDIRCGAEGNGPEKFIKTHLSAVDGACAERVLKR